MRLSRLFSVMLVVGVATGATIVACGGNSSPHGADAKVFKDSPGGQHDAPAGATGIGKICTGGGSGDPTLCTTSDPLCTSVGGPWFCTEGCGYGSCATGGHFGGSGAQACAGVPGGSAQPAPPSGGDAICMQQKADTTATPVCGLYGDGPSAGSAIAWSCALLCGTSGSNNFGTCPTGLTCSQNFCQ
jgi:hypothetical protein